MNADLPKYEVLDAESDADNLVERTLRSLKNLATVSEALRVLGAAVIVVSMSLFLLKGWSEGNDIRRYLMLLAQTGLMTLAGFALSHGLRETRGARIFFGLALVSVPANFTILGALLYSGLQWDGGLSTYPGFATWRIDDVAGIATTLAGAVFVLIPMTLFCFAVMARHSARTLSLSFLALNALLLVPVRSSMLAGVIAVAGTVFALSAIRRLAGRDRALRTGEGRFALATLFIPVGIVLFRSMYFYEADSLIVALLTFSVFLAARQASVFPGRNPRISAALDIASFPIALLTSIAAADALSPLLVGPALFGPMIATIYAALAFDVMQRTESRRAGDVASVSASGMVAMGFIFGVATSPTILTGGIALAAGSVLLLAGIVLRDRIATLAGSLTLLAAAYFGFGPFVELIFTSSWIALAIFGACVIVLGSLMDRHGAGLKLRVDKWRQSIQRRQLEVRAS